MYRLDHEGQQPDSFRAALTAMAASPFRRLRQLQGTDRTMEEFWALRGVSFEVNAGEVLGVIGRNGAGKSTLLKILSRIVEPTEGRAVMRGRVASLLEVGTGFHPELTGRENIYLNGSILGMRRREIDDKFDQIVDFAEVEKFLDTPVKRYSSGMYVRLAFAVAAHLEPEILIVDEVLAVGDTQFQKKCIGKMKDIAESGERTVVFVSHNMGAVRALCSSCLYLVAGSVASQGSVESVISQYLEPAVHQRQASVVSSYGIQLFEAGMYLPAETSPTRAVYFQDPCEIRIRIGSQGGFEQAGLVVRVFDDLGLLGGCGGFHPRPRPDFPLPRAGDVVDAGTLLGQHLCLSAARWHQIHGGGQLLRVRGAGGLDSRRNRPLQPASWRRPLRERLHCFSRLVGSGVKLVPCTSRCTPRLGR